MLTYCAQQYIDLQKELCSCKSEALPATGDIERCYSMAESYWFRIKAAMKHYVFKDKKETILFFKTIKPKFLSEKEYYSLLYHAALFMPSDKLAEIDFWLRESGRMDKFIKENENFYNYYKAGNCDLDEDLFLDEEIEAEGISIASHAQLIATFIALERYDGYVNQQIEMLSRSKSW